MTAKKLKDVLQRVEAWPEAAQVELAELALEIDAELGIGIYKPTPVEFKGIDRGLKAAREGRIATGDRSRSFSKSTGLHEGCLHRRGPRKSRRDSCLHRLSLPDDLWAFKYACGRSSLVSVGGQKAHSKLKGDPACGSCRFSGTPTRYSIGERARRSRFSTSITSRRTSRETPDLNSVPYFLEG